MVTKEALPPQLKPVQSKRQSPAVLIEARHLRASYGSHLAVKDVSFSVYSGEVLGLLGPNGAGKSTCMMMLAGLLQPMSGEVFLNGQKFDGQNLEQRRLFGIVPQEYAVYEELSALSNLMFFGRLYGLQKPVLQSRCSEVLEQIGLVESMHRPANTYSGGMKRRLNFGIALMHKPLILILDEPTLGVDPLSRLHLTECIDRQVSDGGCVIYASHYMEEAQSLCKRVVILDHGEVIANDTISHLLAGVASDLYLYLDRTTGLAGQLGDLGRIGTGSNDQPVVIVSAKTPGPNNLTHFTTPPTNLDHVATDDPLPESDFGKKLRLVLDKLASLRIRVLSVETQRSTLERVFLQLTDQSAR